MNDIWAALPVLLTVTIGTSLPLVFAALGGLFSERSGIINIGLEGMMLIGAWATAWAGSWAGSSLWSPWLGMAIGALAGGFYASLHALLTIRAKADPIVSGVALNLLASQVTLLLSLLAFGGKGGSGLLPATVSKIAWGGLSLSPFLPVALLAVGATAFVLWQTPWGLHLRACGEAPSAAKAAGLPVARLQTSAVIASGLLAGFAGAILVQEAGSFSKEMTAGRGYIALAALIFGAWKPGRVLAACLLFGFAYSLHFHLQTSSSSIPSEIVSMLPYLLTLLALAGFVGRMRPPAALGHQD